MPIPRANGIGCGEWSRRVVSSLGNLVHDEREGIENITWTVAGKVKRVERTSSSALDALHFGYGTGGHRIMKQVTDDPDLGTGYREHYIRDAQCLSRPSGSNIMATYRYSNPAGPGVSLRVKEWPIYGSSRVGQYIRGTDMYGEDLLTPPTEYVVVTEPMHPGHTHYELNDHLGNVSAVVTGQLLPGGAASAWQPRLLSAQEYEPFGALLPGRKFDVLQAIPILKLHRMLLVGETVEMDLGGTIVTLASYNAGYTTIGEYLVDIQSALSTNGITGAIANGAIQIGNWPAATALTSPSELASLTTTSSYRFGFNGAEKDDEVHGATGTSYDFGARIYDPRVSRWLSLDPLAAKYPFASPYNFALNNPVFYVDPDGRIVKAFGNFNLYHYIRDVFSNNEALAQWFGSNTVEREYGKVGDVSMKGYMLNPNSMEDFSERAFNKVLRASGVRGEQARIARALFHALKDEEVVEIGVWDTDMMKDADGNQYDRLTSRDVSIVGGEMRKATAKFSQGQAEGNSDMINEAIDEITGGDQQVHRDTESFNAGSGGRTVPPTMDKQGRVVGTKGHIAAKKGGSASETNSRISEGLKEVYPE